MQVEQQSLTSTALRNTIGGAVPPFRSVSASRAPNTEHTGGGVGGCGGLGGEIGGALGGGEKTVSWYDTWPSEATTGVAVGPLK